MSNDPPIDTDEARRVLARLAPELRRSDVVLIGGTALSFWHTRLLGSEPTGAVVTTDIDFQAPGDAIRALGSALDGEVRVEPTTLPTPQSGAASYLDSSGRRRVMEFLRAPAGLRADEVAARAIPVNIAGDGSATVNVMNPLDCLRSRLANLQIPGRDLDHALAQLRVAVQLVPAYGRLLLDTGQPDRHVLAVNEEVYALAETPAAVNTWLEHRIDVARASVIDERLPAAFTQRRLPQLEAHLQKIRNDTARRRGVAADLPRLPEQGYRR